MARKKKPPPSFDDQVEKMFRDGEQYQRDVWKVAEKLGPASPEFIEWCAEMDAWNAAT